MISFKESIPNQHRTLQLVFREKGRNSGAAVRFKNMASQSQGWARSSCGQGGDS